MCSTIGAGAVALSRLCCWTEVGKAAQVVVHVNKANNVSNANNTVHQLSQIDLCPAIRSCDWHPVLIVPGARCVGGGNFPVVNSTRFIAHFLHRSCGRPSVGFRVELRWDGAIYCLYSQPLFTSCRGTPRNRHRALGSGFGGHWLVRSFIWPKEWVYVPTML